MKDEERKLLRKHRQTKPDKELAEEQVKAKIQYSKDMNEVEANLMKYFEKIDPVIDEDSGDCIGWSKRPSLDQLELMNPPDVPDELDTLEKNKRYMEWNERQFKLIAELIEIPKHPATWWKKHFGPHFIALYQKHTARVMKQLATNIENL